jgi:hypothetical protein
MSFFHTPAKSKAETVKIGLCIDFKVINRFRLGVGIMHMGDCLGDYVFFDENMENMMAQPRYVNHLGVSEDVFAEDAKILEINSKSGLYPLYMAYGIYKRIVDAKYPKKEEIPTIDEQHKIWDKVKADNIFVLCKTPMAKSITKRTIAGFREVKVNTRYFEDLVN